MASRRLKAGDWRAWGSSATSFALSTGPAVTPDLLEVAEELAAVAGGDPGGQLAFDHVLGSAATLGGGEFRGRRPGGPPEEVDERRPFGVAAATEGEPLLLASGGEDAVGGEALGATVADGAGRAPVPGGVEGGLREHRGGAFGLGQLDRLSLARAAAVAQRGEYGEGAVHPHEEVTGERLHVRLRGGVAVAALDGRARHSIDVGAVAAALDVGAGASVGGQVEEDDVGADGADGVVVEAQLLQRAAREVLGEHVAHGDEALDDGEPLGAAAIDGERALVANDVEEGGAVVPGAGTGVAIGMAGHPGGEPLSDGGRQHRGGGAGGGVPDVRVLDLDAVGAEVGEVERGRLARPDAGEVADADTFERQ